MWYDEIDNSITKTKVSTLVHNGEKYYLGTKNGKNDLLNKLIRDFKSLDLNKTSINAYVDSLCYRFNTPINSTNGLSLTWDQIKEMNKFNISFGSHCVHHIPCSNHSKEIMESEIIDSKNTI